MHGIAERDWKVFRRLAPIALDRYCQRILDQVDALVHSDGMTNHAKYLELYRLIQERDRELAAAFNGHSRSVAVIQLVRMVSLGLLSDHEMADFSEELRDQVRI